MRNLYSMEVNAIKLGIITCIVFLCIFTTNAQEKDICISVSEHTSISFFDGIEQIIDDSPYTIGYSSCSKILKEVRINETICKKTAILLLQHILEGKNLRIIEDGDFLTIEEILEQKHIEPETKSGYVNEDKDPELTSISNEEMPLYKEAASQTFIETTNMGEKAIKKTTTFESINPISRKSLLYIHNNENSQQNAKPKPSKNRFRPYKTIFKSHKQRSFVVYSNWSYFLSQRYYANSNFGYNGLSVAFKSVNKKSNFRQYELKSGIRRKDEQSEQKEPVTIYHSSDSTSMVNPNPVVVDYRSNRFFSLVKFEFGRHKESRKLNNLSFEYGLALRLFYYRDAAIPQTPNNWFYSNKNVSFGLGLSFIANMEYDISEQFYIQLNASIIDFSFGANSGSNDNPNTLVSSYGNYEIFIGEQLLRFGVGYNFNQQPKKVKRNKKRRR